MQVPALIYEAMVTHARFSLPDEACGLLASDSDGRLRMCYCLTNADRSPTVYTIDPVEHFRALQHAERNGWALSGAFHSHTRSAPVPSETDRRRAYERDWVYFIVGPVESPDVGIRGYRIRDGVATEVPLTVV